MIKFIKNLIAVLLLSPTFLLASTLATAMLFATLAVAIATAVMFGVAAFPAFVLYQTFVKGHKQKDQPNE